MNKWEARSRHTPCERRRARSSRTRRVSHAASQFLRHADIHVTSMHYADHKERVTVDHGRSADTGKCDQTSPHSKRPGRRASSSEAKTKEGTNERYQISGFAVLADNVTAFPAPINGKRARRRRVSS